MSESCFDSVVSCRDPKLGCVSIGRLQSLVCNAVFLPGFCCCIVTVKVKLVEGNTP